MANMDTVAITHNAMKCCGTCQDCLTVYIDDYALLIHDSSDDAQAVSNYPLVTDVPNNTSILVSD